MPNPKPLQTKEFIERQFKPKGEIPGNQPLAKRPTSVKLPVDVDAAIRALPEEERASWLRRVLCNAARTELIAN